MKISSCDIEAFTTKDGSIIRELMNPRLQEGFPMSIAEATIFKGSRTHKHIHKTSHEIYHITEGKGRMYLGNETFEVKPGDTVFIEPSKPHCMENIGGRSLKFLCCCCPPYDHEDTVLFDELTS
jgi:mannose-6-phosphate isomerase-like protein (cupin superfamily)